MPSPPVWDTLADAHAHVHLAQAAARTAQLQGRLHAAQAEAGTANAAWAKQRAAQEQHKTARQRLQQARALDSGARQ